jgi:hypothetical protein
MFPHLARFTACVHSLDDLLGLINEAGFLLFSNIPGVELPGMGQALSPEVQNELWGWKDALPNTRQVYYGALFHPHPKWEARPGFVSLSMLTALYALAPISQLGGDRSLLPRWGHLSVEAQAITRALERDGALPTRELRPITGMDGKANATRFERALIEAQSHFLVVKIGVTSTTRGNYGYVWDLFERVYPTIITQAETFTEQQAARAIWEKYTATAPGVTPQRVAEMLKLTPGLFSPLLPPQTD